MKIPSVQKIIATALIFFITAFPLYAADVYVAQTVTGGGSAVSCATARALAGTTWTAGNIYHLCGTITSVVAPSSSGSAGNVITLQWESGASVSNCNTTGAVQLGGRSYILLDLGNNSAAVTCPNNGDALATQIMAIGISDNLGSGMDHIEVRNGTIGPLYVKNGAAHNNDNGSDSTGMYQNGGGNNHYHNLTFSNLGKGINDQLSGTITGDEIDNNTFLHFGAGIYYACGGSPCAESGALLHDNTFTNVADWATVGDFTHLESVHIYSNGAGTSIGFLLYNNTTTGAFPTTVGGSNPNFTAAYFVEQATTSRSGGSQTGLIFNNICRMDTGWPGDGCIFIQSDNNNIVIANNVNDCVDNTKHDAAGMELDQDSSNTISIYNNLNINCGEPVYSPGSGGGPVGDFNNYFHFGSGNGWNWSGSFFTTLAGWRGACGCDATSTTVNPQQNLNYTLQAGSPMIGAGANLTFFSAPQLDLDKAGVARPPSGNWAIGPYQFVSAGGSTSNSPSPFVLGY